MNMKSKQYYSYDEVLEFFSLFNLIDLLRSIQVRIVKYMDDEMDVLVAQKDISPLNFRKTDSYHFTGYIEYIYHEKLIDNKQTIYFTYNDIYEPIRIFNKKEYMDTSDLKYWHCPSNRTNWGVIKDGLKDFSFVKEDIDKARQGFNLSVSDSELPPRAANNASKIISALCELNKLDTTQPLGQTNKKIMDALERLGTPLSKDTVGKWLKLAHENTK